MLSQLKRRHIIAIAVSFLTLLVALALGTSGHEILGGCGDFCRRLGCGHATATGLKSQFESHLSQGDTPGEEATMAIACQLSEEGFGERMDLVRELYSGVLSSEELQDGYALTYPGNDEWAEKLTDFIRSERECCPFFVFELKFEPERGPIRLSIRGGEGVKEFLEGIRIDGS